MGYISEVTFRFSKEKSSECESMLEDFIKKIEKIDKNVIISITKQYDK